MPATDAPRTAPSVARPVAPAHGAGGGAPRDPRAPSRRRAGPRRPRPLRFLALLALLTLALPAAAQGSAEDGEAAGDEAALTPSNVEDAIARLTVVPAGEQAFDLLTGVTTLPDGGTIVDQETGLTLVADHIRYVEGEYIEAQGARAETEAGTLTAASLRIDVPSLTAFATEGIAFERPGLRFEAAAAEYAFADSLVRFERPVGQDPALEASALLLAVDSGDALLLGPYRYAQGLFTLSDEREDAALQLRPVTAEDGTPGYRAANEVDPDLWARVAPLR